MTLAAGSCLGPYQVLAPLGAGGMGEVYRARDTRLDRVVAIKVLRAHLAADPDRRARFEREAKLISQLSHPHICTLYDVGQTEGTDYLVIEYLEGRTLANRLHKGPLSMDQALQYAIQIAGALEAAHRQGIVHRDLKPANVMLTKGGAKLLDFGIAKAAASGTASLTAAPTLTAEGMLVGTLQYMAPEQLEGLEADARSDLFAFGAVLYEMLTGRRAFAGSSQSSVIAAILDSDPPPVATVQPRTPPALDHVVTTCLAKNPDDRWQSAADVRRELEWIAASAGSARLAAAGPRSGARLAWTVAVVASLVAASALTWYVRTEFREKTSPPRVTRMTIATPGVAAVSLNSGRSVAITPDGTRIVYTGNKGTQLFVRPLDQLESTAIYTGVLPLNEVFVSPDSQWVGFGEGNTIRKIGLAGGPAQTIVPGVGGYGAAWAPDDTIIFPTIDKATGLNRVPAGGGPVTMLTRPDPSHGEQAHVFPEMLPGGRAVLFTITAITGGLAAAQVAVLDLATGTYKVLVRGGSDAHYVPSGHLVYVLGSTLAAVPFDLARLEIRGTTAPVVLRLATSVLGSGHFDAAADGTLAYVDADPIDAAAAKARTLVWVDRHGGEDPLSASLSADPYSQPRVSPDGTLVAVGLGDHIWLWNIAGRTFRKLTSDAEAGFFFPVWAQDSHRLFFGRSGGGLFSKSADGTGKTEVLSNARGPGMLPSGVTADGTRVLFSLGARDVMAMALDTHRVEPLVQTPFDERNGVVSPDGRWLAYESKGSTGPFEICVKPYPNVSAGEWPISTDGGMRPLWSPNGLELFFMALDGAIMAVPVDPRSSTWNAGTPVKLFKGPYETGLPASGRNYDVSPDGKRFLMVKESPAVTRATPPQLVVVQNWVEELKRLAPVN